jgi:hypothetical protein
MLSQGPKLTKAAGLVSISTLDATGIWAYAARWRRG